MTLSTASYVLIVHAFKHAFVYTYDRQISVTHTVG